MREEIRPGVYRIRDWSRNRRETKRRPDLAIIGRYILTPDIFPAWKPRSAIAPVKSSSRTVLRHLLSNDRSTDAESMAPSRYRQQARIPEGRRLLRAAPPDLNSAS
jgi:hypothetical protein